MLDQELQELWQETPPDMQIKFSQSKLIWIFYGFYLLFGIGVQMFVWWMNRQALIKEFNPILKQIENTIQSLESS
mgnify:CR=1 FL=1